MAKKVMKLKAISISFILFAIIVLLIPSTTALAATAIRNESSISDVNGSNNNSVQKQSEQKQQQPNTHIYTLIAENTTLEIAPGVRVDAWTYNHTIPGPTLTATEGDRVIIHFINKTPLPHTVHLHGDHPSEQDGVFEQIPANGTYTYDFIANPAGALMYHCHVSPVMQHVRMGLYGAFVVYPKEPLPPAREYVLVEGEYDTQNQLNPVPEYYMFNGYAEQYMAHPLPAKTNETVRIYLVNLGLSPAYGIHIHGTLFKAYPSGIWQNSPLKVQSWEIGSGNAAILEAKWPWPGKFTFHFHGIPEERGAMGYFNVTNPTTNDVDGKDVASTKSISMTNWQTNLTKSLQKQDPNGKVITTTTADHNNEMKGMEEHHQQFASQPSYSNTSKVSIVRGAAALGNKAFLPDLVKIKLGNTVTWTNNDNNLHTVTSGTPNTANAGEAFDSGLTALIMPAKTYSHKFTNSGNFPYFCRVHPTMVGKIEVVSDTNSTDNR
ncbi:MAG TPA: multicopper oxidase domain-containing protein [Nitrososphaeraceae archaeon]|nr:multicopper oxidase domain-containing protein [Nitrososphaeraceae archaeon]